MDNRKNNGGNSTKALGIDKRKNDYKLAIDQASNVEDVVVILKKISSLAKDGDLMACKLFLSYYLGMPKQIVLQENLNYEVVELTPERAKEVKKIFDADY
jgi:hypothetical protein